MPHALYPFFHPQAVAVVGASDRYGSSGRRVFGRLSADPAVPLAVPVNTRHKTVGGQTAYENLAAACKDHPIDTAVVILSADKISGIIAEAAKAGIRQMVVVNDWEQPVPSAAAKLKRAADAAVKSGIRMLAVPTAGIEGLYRCNPIRSCTYIGQSVGIAASETMRPNAALFSNALSQPTPSIRRSVPDGLSILPLQKKAPRHCWYTSAASTGDRN